MSNCQYCLLFLLCHNFCPFYCPAFHLQFEICFCTREVDETKNLTISIDACYNNQIYAHPKLILDLVHSFNTLSTRFDDWFPLFLYRLTFRPSKRYISTLVAAVMLWCACIAAPKTDVSVDTFNVLRKRALCFPEDAFVPSFLSIKIFSSLYSTFTSSNSTCNSLCSSVSSSFSIIYLLCSTTTASRTVIHFSRTTLASLCLSFISLYPTVTFSSLTNTSSTWTIPSFCSLFL